MASYREIAGALEALCRATRYGKIGPGSVLLAQCEALAAEARKGRLTETAWTPFVEASATQQPNTRMRVKVGEVFGVSDAAIKALWQREIEQHTIWANSRYQVMRRASEDGAVIYLSIKRLDQQPIRSWRDLQRIKNELVGPENEAVELFPADSRVLDAANQYHLWVSSNPAMRLPFGFNQGRHVMADINAGEGQEPLTAEGVR
jgi:hypothetical protein